MKHSTDLHYYDFSSSLIFDKKYLLHKHVLMTDGYKVLTTWGDVYVSRARLPLSNGMLINKFYCTVWVVLYLVWSRTISILVFHSTIEIAQNRNKSNTIHSRQQNLLIYIPLNNGCLSFQRIFFSERIYEEVSRLTMCAITSWSYVNFPTVSIHWVSSCFFILIKLLFSEWSSMWVHFLDWLHS